MDTNATFPQAVHLLNLFGEKKMSKDRLNALIRSGLLADLLDANVDEVNRDDFRKLLGLTPAELKITVDYTHTLEEMIAAGHYDWVNDHITSDRFPIMGEGKQELVAELVHFGRVMSTQEVEEALKKRNLRPATIAELLAFGTTYPELLRQFPIVALGSFTEIIGGRHVPCLYEDVSNRELSLSWCGHGWDDRCRFLAFRK